MRSVLGSLHTTVYSVSLSQYWWCRDSEVFDFSVKRTVKSSYVILKETSIRNTENGKDLQPCLIAFAYHMKSIEVYSV